MQNSHPNVIHEISKQFSTRKNRSRVNGEQKKKRNNFVMSKAMQILFHAT